MVLERDGNYPAVEELIEELRAASAAASGAGALNPPVWEAGGPKPAAAPDDVMRTLAVLYTDDRALEAYLEGDNPLGLDRDDLRVAARSFARKRAARH